ncbi:hypothetical protein WR164_12620 [Philodulcilactobacillus myokoensis]|uniref:Uncharacterized protein n=1 Tax=Philodulcilactobacillus myokoensis TaxID=2929573 RepID=A0A9W6B259_9LACO|nr:hypothetical protein [Philodulcilactobacillus myokoensis]GLB47283.1 hypothetical protein WR164_12620 [Philodulcilactobacillus myokoensis]
MIELYENFIQKNKKLVRGLQKKYSNRGYAKKLDGELLEVFIKDLRLHFIPDEIMGVYNITTNKLGKIIVPDTLIGNSAELCIKNNIIINYDTIKIENII